MRRILYALILLGLLASTGAGAEPGLLPDRFGPWKADGPAKIRTLTDLRPDWTEWTNGGDVLREAGLTRIEDRNYKNGSEEWPLRVEVFKDPSSAYEFYTFRLKPGMSDWNIGDAGGGSEDEGSVLVGNLILLVHLNGKPEGLREVVAALRKKADATPLPPLKTYLPVKWHVFGTERYALGPIGFRAAMNSLGQGAYADLVDHVGYQYGVEAILAKYQGEYGSGVLLLLDYPTPQLAEQHLHHLREVLPEAAKRAGVTVERKASLLSLVFEPTSEMHAQAIRDEVNYETEVTWNEPSHTATDPPMVSIMVKIFLFTGLFMGIATAVGVAFGGLRVIIKRLFPGKVFDRPQDIEVLQLGLSGKKIDPSDMY